MCLNRIGLQIVEIREQQNSSKREKKTKNLFCQNIQISQKEIKRSQICCYKTSTEIKNA